jgi:hypothetical protein
LIQPSHWLEVLQSTTDRCMLHGIKNGTLIIAQGLLLPSACELKTLPLCAGWNTVTNIQAQGLDKRFSEMGWSCFQKSLASTVKVVGFGREPTLIKAFQKIVRHSARVKFNCLEVTEAVQKNFLGFSYVHLSARARNIKQRLW